MSMKLLRLLSRSGPTAPIARERLQILLAHERGLRGQPNLLEILREEILAVVSRHVMLDSKKVNVNMDKGRSVSTLEVDIELPYGFDKPDCSSGLKWPPVPRGRRLRHPGPRWCGNIVLGKPHRSAAFPRRDVDQHQAHRPLAQPILRDRTLPARKRQFPAREFMALLSLVDSTPRAYRLKASNAAPPISTFAGPVRDNASADRDTWLLNCDRCSGSRRGSMALAPLCNSENARCRN